MAGVVGRLGVGGTLGSRRWRFQNPAFGPFVTKASVQRERPRRVSGRCVAAVSRVAIDRINASLGGSKSAQHIPNAKQSRNSPLHKLNTPIPALHPTIR